MPEETTTTTTTEPASVTKAGENSTERTATATEEPAEGWQKHARTWESRAEENLRKLAKTEAELEKVRKASQTDQEKALDEAKAQGRTEALTVANQRLVKAAVTAAAAGRLADPTDAAALIDLTQFEVNDKGDVDEKAITTAIEKLVESKPHLAAKSGKPADLRQGARGGPTGELNPNDWFRRQAGR